MIPGTVESVGHDAGERSASDESGPRLPRLTRYTSAHRWDIARLAGFLVITLFLAFGNPVTIGDRIVGDPGDAFLIYALLIWGGDRSVHLFSGYWDGPMFAGGSDVMTYTDTFLPLVPPFKLIEWLTSSPIVAFNLLYIASWVLTCEFTYRLAMRVCASRPAAFLGSVAFTFSTIRIAQTNHFQLAWAAFIPLAILAMLRFRERPSVGRGTALALVLVTQFLTSAYYGVVLFVAAAVFVATISVCWLVQRRPLPEFGPGVCAFGITLAVTVLPFFRWYSQATETRTPSEGYRAVFALSLGDLRSAAPRSRFMRDFGVLDTDTLVRSGENYAYLGVFVLVFVTGFVLWGKPWREKVGPDSGHRWALLTTLAIGTFALLFAFGRGPIFGIRMPFYDAIISVLPAFESVTALVREFVFMQLALVLFATVTFARLLELIPKRWVRFGLTTVLISIVVVESMVTVISVEVPEVTDGSVYDAMQDLDAGVAAQLPIGSSVTPLRPFLETSRMVLGVDDDIQIVNGYSGFEPIDYEESVQKINDFPSSESLAELNRLGVRYIVLHSGPVDTGMDDLSALLNDSGTAFFTTDEVERRIELIPPGAVDETIRANDGVIVVLV